MISECPGCSKVIEVRCGKCGSANVSREFACAALDAVFEAITKQKQAAENAIYVCYNCARTFEGGEGGHESRWCSACLDRMVISDREFMTGEREL